MIYFNTIKCGLLVILISITNAVYCQDKPNINYPFDLQKIYSYALQGHVYKILSIFDSIPNEILTEEQKNIKEKYVYRFDKQDEVFDFKTTDTSVLQIMKIYQSYWKDVLLNKENSKENEKKLKNCIGTYIYTIHYKNKLSKKKICKNFTDYTKTVLEKKGYYSATGITAGIFDLLIWGKELKIEYNIKLPEGMIKVPVVFMDSIITMGWEEYATFGKYYPGGWATEKELYCVKNTYDTTSEKFKISYLQHEGQHFFDYKSYTNLSSADLEYRAKLTELCFLQENLFNTISFFIKNASNQNKDNAHAFANYYIINDLSKKIFNQEFVTDINRWKELSPQHIHKTSEELLKQNSIYLRKKRK